jgi:hypothetical protein
MSKGFWMPANEPPKNSLHEDLVLLLKMRYGESYGRPIILDEGDLPYLEGVNDGLCQKCDASIRQDCYELIEAIKEFGAVKVTVEWENR